MTLILKKLNQFDIGVTYINMARSEVSFEQYRMVLNWENMTLRFEMMMKWIVTEYSLISCNERSIVWMDYINMKNIFWYIISLKINRGRRVQRKLKNWRDKKSPETKEIKVHLILLKKSCFVNTKTQTSQATSNNYNSNFNSGIPEWSEAISSE